jgi:hypothetical protein
MDKYEILDKGLTRITRKDRNAWWIPGENLLVNETLLGALNLWEFRILPQHIGRECVRKNPEGFLIDPRWESIADGRTLHDAREVVRIVKDHAFEIESVVRGSLSHVIKACERDGITVPQSVLDAVEAQALKDAPRRWFVNGLRRSRFFIPFDGGKRVRLSATDTI